MANRSQYPRLFLLCLAALVAVCGCAAAGTHTLVLRKGHVWLLADGRCGIESPSKLVAEKVLRGAVRAMVRESKSGALETLHVHTELDTRMRCLQELVDVAGACGIKDINLTANGKSICLRLIVSSRGMAHILTFNLKVFWYKTGTASRFPERNPFKESFRDYAARVRDGYAAVLIEGRMFVDSSWKPDFQMLEEYLNKCMEDFVPTNTFPSLPVCFVVDEMVTIDFLFQVIETCRKVGINEFSIPAE